MEYKIGIYKQIAKKTGLTYYFGKITTDDGKEIKLSLFNNKYKKESKHPDINAILNIEITGEGEAVKSVGGDIEFGEGVSKTVDEETPF